ICSLLQIKRYFPERCRTRYREALSTLPLCNCEMISENQRAAEDLNFTDSVCWFRLASSVMHTGVFWQVVYWFSLPVFAVLTVVLVRRGLQRQFSFFVPHIAVAFLSGLVRLLAYRITYRIYLYAYWISEAAITTAALLAARMTSILSEIAAWLSMPVL